MKKGVLKVTPAKDYKLVRIQVGHLEKVKYDTKNDPDYGNKNYSTSDVTKTDRKTVETTTSHCVDLNGDGDFDDVVNGIDEDYVLYRYKTVKTKAELRFQKYHHTQKRAPVNQPYITTPTQVKMNTPHHMIVTGDIALQLLQA